MIKDRRRFIMANQKEEDVPIAIPVDGLNLWLKADVFELLSNGDAVGSWTDSSGNNNHAEQTIGDRQPKYITDALNGLPSIRFDGIDDYYIINNTVFNGINTGATIFLVLKHFSLTDSSTFGAEPDDTNNRFLSHFPLKNKVAYFDFGNIGAGGRVSISSQVNTNEVVMGIFMAGYNKTTIKVARPPLYDFTQSQVNSSSMFNPTGKVLYMGQNSSLTAEYMNCDVFEFIIYNKVLSEIEILEVEDYLKLKYGL